MTDNDTPDDFAEAHLYPGWNSDTGIESVEPTLGGGFDVTTTDGTTWHITVEKLP
jgi:hypothetical protein